MLVTVVLCAGAAVGENVSCSFSPLNRLLHFRVTGSVSLQALGLFVGIVALLRVNRLRVKNYKNTARTMNRNGEELNNEPQITAPYHRDI